ncbi:hypothetical protein [Kistimonas asteriae]|uniref:hypothetical protein n=1 Tax=Kistimonas asteriae TaxID=517724 RepID=UPI001BA49204|nr:hypothetical protein [Kistimonas asteriae]
MEIAFIPDNTNAFCSPEQRAEERETLAAQVEFFLKSGGKVTQVGQIELNHEFDASSATRQGRSINSRRLAAKFNHKKLRSSRDWIKRNPNDLVTVEEVSKLTGAHVTTVKNWKNHNGRRYRLMPVQNDPMLFSLAEVIRWMDNHLALAAEYRK